MKVTLALTTVAVVIGLALTVASSVVSHFNGYENSVSFISMYAKGYPLPYLFVEPSISHNNAREPVSLLWQGNAWHGVDPLGLVADVLFWSALSGVLVAGLYWIFGSEKRARLVRQPPPAITLKSSA